MIRTSPNWPRPTGIGAPAPGFGVGGALSPTMPIVNDDLPFDLPWDEGRTPSEFSAAAFGSDPAGSPAGYRPPGSFPGPSAGAGGRSAGAAGSFAGPDERSAGVARPPLP